VGEIFRESSDNSVLEEDVRGGGEVGVDDTGVLEEIRVRVAGEAAGEKGSHRILKSNDNRVIVSVWQLSNRE
jgi:hypothetical protein